MVVGHTAATSARRSAMRTSQADVLVVGAGPAGLAASALLARYGVSAITVTKHASTANSPRAHITNQRTGEVLRDLGIEERVRAFATPSNLMGNNVWAASFAGQEIARLMTWGSGPERRADYDNASPSAMMNVPQHLLEPVLLDAARSHGADIRFSTELVSITQDDYAVHAVVRERESGDEYAIAARYAIGADGGRSTVAAQLGFPMQGQMGLGASVNVWLEADLTKYTAHRPGVLYWISQPGNDFWVGSGTWICVKPWTQAVGNKGVDRAMKGVADMLPISTALGFRPDQSMDEGWAGLHELAEASAAGAARRQQLQSAVELQNYQFNTHGVELGQSYSSDAVVPDGSDAPAPARDQELYYTPSTRPGGRLPHVWLQAGTDTVSTLDICSAEELTLIVGVGGEPWIRAAEKTAADLGARLSTRSVGYRQLYDDVCGDWGRISGVDDGGCLLGRPDRHIAWRSARLPDDPAAGLRPGLRRGLARAEPAHRRATPRPPPRGTH